jgi:hypothetical protein
LYGGNPISGDQSQRWEAPGFVAGKEGKDVFDEFLWERHGCLVSEDGPQPLYAESISSIA